MKKMLYRAIICVFVAITAAMIIYVTKFTGRTPDENGIVSFDNWDIMPYNDNICTAGTMFESGRVMLSITRKINDNSYVFKIQSSTLNFPTEIFNKEIPTTVASDSFSKIVFTKSIITDANTVSIPIHYDQLGYFIKNKSTVSFAFSKDKVIQFEFGSLKEVLNEINNCIKRLEE